jgi:hypothetical protein
VEVAAAHPLLTHLEIGEHRGQRGWLVGLPSCRFLSA